MGACKLGIGHQSQKGLASQPRMQGGEKLSLEQIREFLEASQDGQFEVKDRLAVVRFSSGLILGNIASAKHPYKRSWMLGTWLMTNSSTVLWL